MSRVAGARKQNLPDDLRKAWEQEEASRGAPQPNLPVYALRLADGIEESGLLSKELKHLASLKAALINGCPF
jgi:hypothetical protein